LSKGKGETERGEDRADAPAGFWVGFEEGRAAAEGQAPPPPRLSGALRTRLLKRFGGTARARIGAAAGFRAISVLLKKHPDAALDMAGAAALEAGRSSYSELKRLLLRRKPGAGPSLSLPEDKGRATR